jgi:hypothetical protein
MSVMAIYQQASLASGGNRAVDATCIGIFSPRGNIQYA